MIDGFDAHAIDKDQLTPRSNTLSGRRLSQVSFKS